MAYRRGGDLGSKSHWSDPMLRAYARAERDAVRVCLEALEILAVTGDILRDAVERSGPDFEDDILISAAVAHAVDVIVTRDGPGFARSPVDVHEPGDFARIIAR